MESQSGKRFTAVHLSALIVWLLIGPYLCLMVVDSLFAEKTVGPRLLGFLVMFVNRVQLQDSEVTCNTGKSSLTSSMLLAGRGAIAAPSQRMAGCGSLMRIGDGGRRYIVQSD